GEAALFIAAEDPLDPESVHSVQRWSAGEVAWEVELPRDFFAVAIDDANGNTVIVGGFPIGCKCGVSGDGLWTEAHESGCEGELVHEATLDGLDGLVHEAAVQGAELFLVGQSGPQLWAARATDFAIDWVTPVLQPPVNGHIGLAVSENIVLVAYLGQGVALK